MSTHQVGLDYEDWNSGKYVVERTERWRRLGTGKKDVPIGPALSISRDRSLASGTLSKSLYQPRTQEYLQCCPLIRSRYHEAVSGMKTSLQHT